MQPRLMRSRTDRMIAGVCGGLGQYFGVDPVIIRLIFVVLALTTFITPFLYLILWVIMPEAPAMPPPRYDPLTGQPVPPPVTGQTIGLGGAAPNATSTHGRQRTLGLLLLGIGALVLLNGVGEMLSHMLGFDLSDYLLPLLLIGLGVYLLRRH